MERNNDRHGRWRNRTVAFRMSEEEAVLLNRLVALSGLTKQDYIIDRLTGREVVIVGNPRVYKALRDQLTAVLEELRRLDSMEDAQPELMELIRMIAVILGGMKGEDGNGN